jgi:hypothetical protein
MATLIHNLSVMSDGSVHVVGESVPRLVRVLHELELPEARRITPSNRPEVRQMFPVHFVPFTRAWQMKSYEMNRPWLTPTKWTVVYANNLWITNDQGFNEPGDPRANYVTGTNLDQEDPRVECLTCGGNLLRVLGEVRAKTNAGLEECYIIQTLDYRNPPPAILPRWLTTIAVSMDSNGTPRRFPQGQQPNGFMPDILHPLLADPRQYDGQDGHDFITIPKWRCEPWGADTCDPYKLYRPV